MGDLMLKLYILPKIEPVNNTFEICENLGSLGVVFRPNLGIPRILVCDAGNITGATT